MTKASNLIARQPICTQELKTMGYEILYRMGGNSNQALINDADNASSDVLLALFNDLELSDVVGNKPAFINFTSHLIIQGLPNIPPKKLVVELLEDQEINEALLSSLTQLKKQGYRIALDDFYLNHMTKQLIDYADIIKIDVLAHSPEELQVLIPTIKSKGVIFLAEKVETHEMFEQCCNLGFDLFQGYFFEKPKIITGKRLGNTQRTVIDLMNEIVKQNVDIDTIIHLISKDLNISYNLLRSINSGLYYLPKKITSIKHAIVLLGLKKLKNWIKIIALSTLNDKPQLLSESAMLRAKMCEQLGAMLSNHELSDQYFTLGLFSLIDTFFDTPMDDILKKLSLPDEIEEALRFYKGTMGNVLICVIDYQTGNWEKKSQNTLIIEGKLTEQQCKDAYISSIEWVEENKFL